MLEPHTAEARSILDDERQCDVSIPFESMNSSVIAGGGRFLNFTATAIQKRLNYISPSNFSEQRGSNSSGPLDRENIPNSPSFAYIAQLPPRFARRVRPLES